MIIKYDHLHGDEQSRPAAATESVTLKLGFSTVNDLMTKNPSSMTPDTRLGDAIRKFRELGIGHIPVAISGRLQGILSDRDALRFMAGGNADAETPIESVMTPDPISVERMELVSDAIAKIMRHRVHCLPVVEGDQRLVGIITTTDLLRALYATVMYLERHQPSRAA